MFNLVPLSIYAYDVKFRTMSLLILSR